MPATEQTWRSMKVMHVVFGVSALVMTLATFWLMAKDHNREWKDLQLDDRKKEAWMLAARRAAMTDQYASRMEQLQRDLRVVRSKPIDPKQIEQFEDLVERGNAQMRDELSKLDVKIKQIGFDQLHEAYGTFHAAALEAQETAAAVSKQTESVESASEDQGMVGPGEVGKAGERWALWRQRRTTRWQRVPSCSRPWASSSPRVNAAKNCWWAKRNSSMRTVPPR